MKDAYILGDEKQSSYWNDIRKFEPGKAGWNEVKKKLIAYMDVLEQKYGDLEYVEKATDFSNLFYDKLLDKFSYIEQYKTLYSFLEDGSIAEKVKNGIKDLRNEHEDFGMSAIVHEINLARNHEDNLFKIDCDEVMGKEIASFCRGSYLWTYKDYVGRDFESPYSDNKWKEKWESDVHLQIWNSARGEHAELFFDIESALVRKSYLAPISFKEIDKLRNAWPNDYSFEDISDKMLAGKDIDAKERDAWNTIVDNLLEKLRWKKGKRSKLLATLSRIPSLLFKKENRQRVIIPQFLHEYSKVGDYYMPVPPQVTTIIAIIKCAYWVSQIEKEERREEFIEETKGALK